MVTLNPVLDPFTMARLQEPAPGRQTVQKRGQPKAQTSGIVQQADRVMAGGDGNDWFGPDGALVWGDGLQN